MNKFIITINIILSIGFIRAYSQNPVLIDIGDLRYNLYEECAAVVDVLLCPPRVDIPAQITYEGKVYPVIWLEEKAFMGSDFLERVTIPNSVKYIDSRAFEGCTALDSLVIPGSVKHFGGSFHPHCYEPGVFGSCTSLSSVVFEEGITMVQDVMLQNCTSLKSVYLPSSLTYVGSFAFSNCPIEEVRIPTLESWCQIGFSSSPLRQGTRLLVGGEEIVDLVVPEGITKLGQKVFLCSSSIETARFPQDLTEISHYCFAYCSSLKYLELPLSLESLGEKCFNCCTSLERIDCYAPTPPAFKKEEYVEWAAPPAMNEMLLHGVGGLIKEISFDDYFAFKGCDVERIELHVPLGTKETYELAEGWSRFSRIIDDLDQSGIDSPVIGNDGGLAPEGSVTDLVEEIYTLQGVKLNIGRTDLPIGVYIIRNASETRKIMVR